jgi:HK97 gp10 family phage protein
MSGQIRIKVDDRKVRRMLKELPDRIERKVLRQAIGPATTPAVKAAKRLAPRDSGLLKKSIAKKIKTYKKTNTAVSIVGPKKDVVEVINGKNKRPSKYAHLVEGGTSPHKIVVTWKGKKVTLQHPGAKATHFLKQAQEASLSQYKSICMQRMADGVIREGQKLGL